MLRLIENFDYPKSNLKRYFTSDHFSQSFGRLKIANLSMLSRLGRVLTLEGQNAGKISTNQYRYAFLLAKCLSNKIEVNINMI